MRDLCKSPSGSEIGIGVHLTNSSAETPHRAQPKHGALLSDLRRTTLWLAAVFWAFVLVADSVLWGLAGSDLGKSLAGKIALSCLGASMALGMSAAIQGLGNRSLFIKAGLGLCLSFVFAPLYAYADFEIFRWIVAPTPARFEWLIFGTTLTSAMAMFFGWSCLFIALVYTYEVRERERRLAVAREEALAAQMRALRYQVNPHFLFNTLNSIAGLIEEGASLRAERMALSLSTFLRTTLELDPMHDVSLATELSLQAEYLGIEQERYSDRMSYSIDVPPEVEQALVPNLILQPLVENALKHGVGRSNAPTAIRIAAWREDDLLRITVENSICDTAPKPAQAGFGIGLKNVADRLQARFGDRGHFQAGIGDEGVFMVQIALPWKVTE